MHRTLLALAAILACGPLAPAGDENAPPLAKLNSDLKAAIERVKRTNEALRGADKPIEGSGRAARRDFAVAGVTAVRHASVGNLAVTAGDRDELRVTADDNILPLLEVVTRDGVLSLSAKPGVNLKPKTPITYRLVVRGKLARVDLVGSGAATVDGATVAATCEAAVSGSGSLTLEKLACDSLALTLVGSGGVTLSGTAAKLTVAASGSGGLKASELKAADARVKLDGSGSAQVWAMDSLKVELNGSGSVDYRGSPAVVEKVAGSGRLRSLER